MSKYKVEVLRTLYAVSNQVIEASDEDEAECIVLEEAHDYDYKTIDAEIEIQYIMETKE